MRSPESVKRSITINVQNNKVRTPAVLCKAVAIDEVGCTPAVARLNPTFKPSQILIDVEPSISNFLWILLVETLLVDGYFQFHLQ